MAQKKYISLSKLQTFLENLNNKFAALSHGHTTADLTDYAVDSALSSTSTNPVANSILDAEFEAVSQAMGVLEQAIDSKADSTHDHNDIYYTKTEIDSYEFITVNDIDTICGSDIASASDLTF